MTVTRPKGANGISRVIKQGSHFICGLCGTRYTQNAAAEACLRACVAKLNPEGVSSLSGEQKGQTFRCTYCKRTYEKFEEAKQCAVQCSATMKKKMEIETKAKTVQVSEDKLRTLAQLSGDGQLISVPTKKKEAPSTPPVAPPARTEEPKAKTKPQTQAPSAPSTPPARERPASPPPKEPVAAAPRPEKKLHPAEGSKFVRDAHLFRCLSCNQKYSSFQEAISCFDAHKQGTFGQVAPGSEGENTVYTREGTKYRCVGCRKLHFTRTDVFACFESHSQENENEGIDISLDAPQTEAPSKAAPAAPSSPPLGEEIEASGKEGSKLRNISVKTEADKYFRDGAKYGCRACKKKYFTKPEVIACFDSHGDDVVLDAPTPTQSPAKSGAAAPVSPSAPKTSSATKPASPAPQPAQAAKEPAKEAPPSSAKAANTAKASISNEQLVDAILESALKESRPASSSGSAGKDSDEKFYRNGAKYVCKKCGAKYFTKDDVVTCFDRHS